MITKNMLIGMVIIIVLLGILFQRASGVFVPLTVVALTIMSTLSLMPIFNVPFTGTTQIIPTFLLAIGIADSVHILSILRHCIICNYI